MPIEVIDFKNATNDTSNIWIISIMTKKICDTFNIFAVSVVEFNNIYSYLWEDNLSNFIKQTSHLNNTEKKCLWIYPEIFSVVK